MSHSGAHHLEESDGGNETDSGFSRSRTPTTFTTSSIVHAEVDEDDEDSGSLHLAHMRRDLDEEVDPSHDPHEQQPYPSHKSFNPLTLPPQVAVPWGHWTEDDSRALKIRGSSFLEDKVKVPTGCPVYQLSWVDMFTMGKEERCPHVASRSESYAFLYHERRMQRLKEKFGDKVVATPVDSSSASYLSPMIVINFLFPGPNGDNMNLVLYMTRRIRPAEEIRRARERKAKRQAGGGGKPGKSSRANNGTGSQPSSPPVSPPNPQRSISKSSSATSSLSQTLKEEKDDGQPHLDTDPDVLNTDIDLQRLAAFDRCMRVFLEGDDHERDSRLKIIPRIAEGPWLVKKGVGTTPAILGRKVKQTYYRNLYKNYIEIDADVGSSVVAGKILSLVKSAATALIIELSFLFQGECDEELPESLLTGVRIIHPSLPNTVGYKENWERTKAGMKFPF